MLLTTDAPPIIYEEAWVGLFLIFGYYCTLSIGLRLGKSRDAGVTRYEPPRGISPAVAAYLLDCSQRERAFAAALVSLAAKKYLTIQQDQDWVTFEKLREADESLPREESAILEELLPASLDTYRFNASDYDRLCASFDKFEETISSIVEPDLISSHRGFWLGGLAISLVVMLYVLVFFPGREDGPSLAGLAYECILLLLGGACFVAALRVWPATLKKLASFLPGNTLPVRSLDVNDAIPFMLTVSAVMGYGLLVYMTSARFAQLLAVMVLLNVIFRDLLETPTWTGQRVREELRGFREFLARADADRLGRENRPGHSPETLDQFVGYAVALNVERGWGEEFAGGLLKLLEIDRAYSWRSSNFLPKEDGPLELRINSRR